MLVAFARGIAALSPRSRATVMVALLCAVALQGCAAAIPVAAVGGLLEAGGGALVKTGTEYTATGAALRTFAIPAADVRRGALDAFQRTGVTVTKDEVAKNGRLAIAGEAEHRKVRVQLIPLAPSLTSMELVVKRNILASDKATASELLAATERVLAENPAFAPRLEDVTTRCSAR